MKYLKCPQCQVMAPAKQYETGERLRCYDCSTPDHPVYVEVIEKEDHRGEGLQPARPRSA